MTNAEPLLHFIHTDLFSEGVDDIPVSDDALRALEATLQQDPTAGDLMPGTGGFRKIRVAVKGKGKRGGARVVYYFVTARRTVYLVMAYDKSESTDVSEAGKKRLRALAKELDAETD